MWILRSGTGTLDPLYFLTHRDWKDHWEEISDDEDEEDNGQVEEIDEERTKGAVVGGIVAEKKQLLGVLSRAVFGCEGSDPTHPNPTLIHPDFKSELESTERNAEMENQV